MQDKPTPITEHQYNDDAIPMVSISCITYNHEPYIRDAIEGFLMQKTTFPVEILIHDDASTDKTADIVKEYEKRYPLLLKSIYQTENQYSQGIKPAKFNRNRAKGKYYAICEGDDYWTDPLKLQKQVDFLEKNQDYGFVYTDYQIINQNGDIIKNYPLLSSMRNNYAHGSVFFQLLSKGNFIPTLTVLFKRNIYENIYEKHNVIPETKKKHIVDYWVWHHFAIHTKFGFLPEVTAHYRKHPGGATSKTNIKRHKEKSGQIFYDILCYFDKHRSEKKLSSGEKAVVFRKSLTVLRNRHISAKQRLKIFQLALKYFSAKGFFSLISKKLS